MACGGLWRGCGSYQWSVFSNQFIDLRVRRLRDSDAVLVMIGRSMKIVRYSKDVDILMVKVSDEPIAYAEEAERFIVHFSNECKPVLLEIMDAKYFVLESLEFMLTATMGEGVAYAIEKKELSAATTE